jgi:AcrR family transcriptional regulator
LEAERQVASGPGAEAGDGERVGRRELRRRANVEALLAAAHRLVQSQGEDFTTQDLINEAEIALQTFYRHFKNKDELFLAVLRDLIAAHCKALAQRAASLDRPVERLQFYVTDTITAMISEPGRTGPRFITTQHWRLQQSHTAALGEANRPFADLLEGELRRAHTQGVLTSEDPASDAWMMSRLILSVVHHHAFDDTAPDATAIAAKVWAFCLAAVNGNIHHD